MPDSILHKHYIHQAGKGIISALSQLDYFGDGQLPALADLEIAEFDGLFDLIHFLSEDLFAERIAYFC